MGSTRLPGKVLAPLEGRPHARADPPPRPGRHSLRAVVVATALRPEDDAIDALAGRLDVACVRGSDSDVLDRFR